MFQAPPCRDVSDDEDTRPVSSSPEVTDEPTHAFDGLALALAAGNPNIEALSRFQRVRMHAGHLPVVTLAKPPVP